MSFQHFVIKFCCKVALGILIAQARDKQAANVWNTVMKLLLFRKSMHDYHLLYLFAMWMRTPFDVFVHLGEYFSTLKSYQVYVFRLWYLVLMLFEIILYLLKGICRQFFELHPHIILYLFINVDDLFLGSLLIGVASKLIHYEVGYATSKCRYNRF